MTSSKSEALRVNVTPELRAEVKALAARLDVSEAHIVRRALRAYLLSKEEQDDDGR